MNPLFPILLLFLGCITCSRRKKKSIISKRRSAYNSIKHNANTLAESEKDIYNSVIPTPVTSIPSKKGNTSTGSVMVSATKYYCPEKYKHHRTKVLLVRTSLLLSLFAAIFNATIPFFRINGQRSLIALLNLLSGGEYECLLKQCVIESDPFGPLFTLGPMQMLTRTINEVIEPGRWMGACEGWGLRAQVFSAGLWMTILVLLSVKEFFKACN